MDSTELKRTSAQEALKFIKDNTIIGLGGGRSIAFIAEYLSEKIKSGFKIKVVTPSLKTRLLCVDYGIEVLPTYAVDEVDVTFDGCDEVDSSFNALKSGGGIHTKEKLIASMAKDYILLVDEEKFSPVLSFKHPVSLEVLKDSLGYVKRKVIELGGKPTVRSGSLKDGFIITDDGNMLIDAEFNEVDDVEGLDKALNNIDGVIGTSLFVGKITKVIIAGNEGLRIISK